MGRFVRPITEDRLLKLLRRFFPEQTGPSRQELPRLLAMMGLFFLVVCAVGVLRPIRNALALDGLGDTDYYKVYLVSAVVVLFVPLYNRLADLVPWRWLIPSVAFTFALELVVLRVFYVEGSTAFGMLFYGWYDLFAAVLVSQFFMATQLFFNARSAKQAYPLVIAGGSIGATLGGAITGFFATTVGTINLLLVAAALIALFSVALPIVWGAQPPARAQRKAPRKVRSGDLRELAANRHVRLIAMSVLITILVKQLVDYQFNTMTKEVFRDRDAISAFQGKFNAVTQWLPIVALTFLQPALKRWGVLFAVMVLPVAMLSTNIFMATAFGLWAAATAKGAENAFRYSTERAGREILYVPVPEEIKLKAKAYIDIAIEKGLGKVTSALLIMVLLLFMQPRQMAWVGIALSIVWIFATLAVRREYTKTLARSIAGRFASLRGSFASLADASTREAVRRALQSSDAGQVAFALELADQATPDDLAHLAPELNKLLGHEDEKLRRRALELLRHAAAEAQAETVEGLLRDRDAGVRAAAAEVLCARGEPTAELERLLDASDARVRTAALTCLVRGVLPEGASRLIGREYIDTHMAAVRAGDAEAKREVALAAGALRPVEPDIIVLLRQLIGDPDPIVANAALESAARLRSSELHDVMIEALGVAATRHAARNALAEQGAEVAAALTTRLLDDRTEPAVRREIPGILARIPDEQTVRALLDSYLAPETDQLLDYRSLKALGKLRARSGSLSFPRELVLQALSRDIEAAVRYEHARTAVRALSTRSARLLDRALDEAWLERRESIFRLLGLLYSPAGVRDCYDRIVRHDGAARANALEWLEQTIDRVTFAQLGPILREKQQTTRAAAGPASLGALHDDNDKWLARLAAHVAGENGGPLDRVGRDEAMDLIEKVFLLQQVDLLQGARSAHLALLASIAEEEDVPAGTILIEAQQPTSAMYLVVRGQVELRGADHTVTVQEGGAFGTWALIDQASSLVTACTTEMTRVLRIDRDDFYDLLNDNPELAIGLLQGLARRVRAVVA